MKIEFQTRRLSGEIRHFNTFKEALKDAEDPTVWKVSFGLPTGERVRLVLYRSRDLDRRIFVLEQMPDFEELKPK